MSTYLETNGLANPKEPIENWRIELIEDPRDVENLLAGAGRIGPGARARLEQILIKARLNMMRFLEVHHFKLLANGDLVVGKIPRKPLYVLQVDLTELLHPGYLARLDKEVQLRNSNSAFYPWLIHGHLKGNAVHIDYICLDRHGGFYSQNRRELWNLEQAKADPPLPAEQLP